MECTPVSKRSTMKILRSDRIRSNVERDGARLPLSARNIYRSDLVAVRDVCCDAQRGECGDEELESETTLVLPIRGAFVWHVGRNEALLDANAAAFFSPRKAHRVSHPYTGGDRCIAIRYSGTMLCESLGTTAVPPKYWILSPAQRSSVHGLMVDLHTDDALAIEERVIGLLGSFATLQPIRQRISAARMVENLRELINARVTADDSLHALTKAVGYSPFHAARVFREITGTTIHQYRHSLRLSLGFDRVRSTDEPIAQIGIDLGFCDHSHFTASFERVFGVTPSVIRNASNKRST